MKPNLRRDLLLAIAEAIDIHAEELAYIEAIEAGKIFAKVLGVEVPNAASMFRYYAGWCDKIHGTTHRSSAPGDKLAFVLKEPVGVVGQILPWNFPLGMAAMKLAPALAAGCVSVLKPAAETSLSALRLGELMLAAGLPAGVLNIMTGDGATGAALVSHPGIDKVAFTGSTPTGRAIIAAAGPNLTRMSLELGGKAPNIVCADADLDHVVRDSTFGQFFNAGQNCLAVSRMLVHASRHDEIVERLAAAASAFRVGGWDEADADMGPLISARQLDRVMDYVRIGSEEGAEVVAGGARIDRPGFFMQPTVLAGCTDDMRVVKEEIFGPVVAIQTFQDADEAIERVNAHQYGLSGAVWTQNLSLAQHFIQSLRLGTVSINAPMAGDRDLPLGGFRQSGWGRENGAEGLSLYLEAKTVVITAL
jgi:phenylacetaldehyde dehydrogenase